MRLRSVLMLKSNSSERYSEGLLMYRFSFSDFLRFMHNSFHKQNIGSADFILIDFGEELVLPREGSRIGGK